MNGITTEEVIPMILISDKAQQAGKHTEKEQYWKSIGIEVMNYPLPCGDYIVANDKVIDVISRKEKRGIPVKKMDFLGTYNVTVDTKKDIQELVGDICGKQHARFRDECILAQNNGIKLYVLVQNAGGLITGTKDIYNSTIQSLDELHKWKNPRLFVMKRTSDVVGYYKSGNPIYRRAQRYPAATRGETLMKACKTMQKKYGVEFVFCHNRDQGEMVLKLLQGEGV